jgi:hypothetical protein
LFYIIPLVLYSVKKIYSLPSGEKWRVNLQQCSN